MDAESGTVTGSGDLAPGIRATVMIDFTPDSLGEYHDVLCVVTEAGTFEVHENVSFVDSLYSEVFGIYFRGYLYIHTSILGIYIGVCRYALFFTFPLFPGHCQHARTFIGPGSQTSPPPALHFLSRIGYSSPSTRRLSSKLSFSRSALSTGKT